MIFVIYLTCYAKLLTDFCQQEYVFHKQSDKDHPKTIKTIQQ